MSYIFPRRVLRPGDVLDPQELTEDITPAADRVSGKLNMHNFDQGVASTIPVSPQAFYETTHYEKTFVPFIWSRPLRGDPAPPWGVPDGTTTPSMMEVQNNFEWQAIIDGTGEAAQVAITTGQSVLWVNAFAQYLWHGFLETPPSGSLWWLRLHRYDAQFDPSNIQFALRVNGNIIAETVTGIDDLTYRASIPIKPTAQRQTGFTDASADRVLPGPQDARGPQVCALGPPSLPVRISACIPCVPGAQLVELVVRRVPLIRTSDVLEYLPGDKVYVYNRQINVVELKAYPIDSVGPAEVTAPALETEDTLNQAALYTNRVQPIIAAYNDVQEGSLARGALMHYHVASALLASATTERDYGSGVAFNNYYPGWLSPARDTVTTTGYSGAQATGWKLITDASNNNPLSVTNVNMSSARKLLILANLHVRNVSGLAVTRTSTAGDESQFDFIPTTTSTESHSAIANFALFQLMYQNVGASATNWTSISESLGMVNNFVWWPALYPSTTLTTAYPTSGIENVDVALLGYIETSVPLPSNINIGVFGSVANEGDQYEFVTGNIIVLSLRG